MVSLAARLTTKKGVLTKRTLKDKSTKAIDLLESVSKKKVVLQGVIDVCKAASSFTKKRTRKSAVLVVDKIHDIRSLGVTSNVSAMLIIAGHLEHRADIDVRSEVEGGHSCMLTGQHQARDWR